ncbi:OB-fold-containig protein [Shewanella salipaludis]|uniref:YqiJ family protein n=1 Tax=Shewanella salipaludis TaxID=2723052 RepID=A0A972FUQ8_9GAMM|nr:OB-fold-containig protein [Shewanella salipaludis]NMH65674.1 YqiJ family protein [Shewanella salipaludis]
MMAFLMVQANVPYTVSLVLVLTLGVVELMTLLTGVSMLNAIDRWVPADVDYDNPEPSLSLSALSGWLSVNRLPLLIWFVLAMSSFALAGFGVNLISLLYSGQMLPQPYSLPLAVCLASLSCHYCGCFLARRLSQDFPETFSVDDLSGCIATITLGCATKGAPSEALVWDQYQRPHYVLVEPESSGRTLDVGARVMLLNYDGQAWSATQFDRDPV